VSYTVLARKWRPKNFSELVGQQHVMQALANALDQQRLHHAYLFTGTRGVGKTTIARIFAKALNCEEGISSKPCGCCSVCKSVDEGRFVDLIEVDAASKTKVEDTRELLENVQYAPVQGRYKVYLIDEVHMLSKSSFNALLKTLEEPPEHVKFLLATTDPHKLPITVLSRCLQFNLMRLTQTQIKNHLSFILEQEKIECDVEALALIAKSADGSARDSLSLLDQAIAFGAGKVRFDEVNTMLGLVDQQFTVDILNALINQSPKEVLETIKSLSQIGVDYHALNDQLLEVFHQILMVQVLGELAEIGIIEEPVLKQIAENLTADKVQSFYQIGLLAKQDMNLAPDIRIAFEMSLLRMLAFDPIQSKEKKQTINSEISIENQPKIAQQATVKLARPSDILVSPQTSQANRPIIKEEQNSYQITEPQKNNEPSLNQSDFINNLKGKINQTLGKAQEAVQKTPKPEPVSKEKTAKVNADIPTKKMEENFADEPLDWQEIIERLHLKGMEAHIANSSILVERTNSKLILSADPEKITFSEVTKVAVEKLQKIVETKLKLELSFIETKQEYLTPNKIKSNEVENRKKMAKESIYNDPQVKYFEEILNMEVIDASIRPK